MKVETSQISQGSPESNNLSSNLATLEERRKKLMQEYHLKKQGKKIGACLDGTDPQQAAASIKANQDTSDTGLMSFNFGSDTAKKPKKMPAGLAARMKKMQNLKEAKQPVVEKEAPPKLQEDIPAKIPQFLSEYLDKIARDLELGNLSNALSLLKQVKNELIHQRKESYCFETSPNLGLEWLLYKQLNAYRSHNENSLKQKFLQIEICENGREKELDGVDRILDRRHIYKLQQIQKSLDQEASGSQFMREACEDKNYRISSQAILCRVFLRQLKSPIFVHKENYNEALEIIQMAIQMNGFLLLDPIIDNESADQDISWKLKVTQALRPQKIMIRKNAQFFHQSPLHLLAELQPDAFDEEYASLTEFLLRTDSFQAPNVIQQDSSFRTPLSIAIDSQNIQFIKIYLDSELVKHHKSLEKVFDLSNFRLCRAIIKNFSPRNQEALSKKRSENNHKFRLAFLETLVKYFNSQIEFDQKGFQKCYQRANMILKKTFFSSNDSLETYEGQIFFSKLYQGDFSKLKIDEHYSFVESLKKLKEIKPLLRKEIDNMPINLTPEDFLCQIFNTRMLLDSYLASNFFVECTIEEMQQLGQICKPFLHMAVNSFTRELWQNKNLLSVESEILGLHFPFENKVIDETSDPSKSLQYALKYACVFQPRNSELHKAIFNLIDFDKENSMFKLQFEISCFIGSYLGVNSEEFSTLFSEKPWLMDEQTLETCDDLVDKRKKIPKIASQMYDIGSYEQLMIKFGNLLIQGHKNDMFAIFFKSMSTYFLSNDIVSEFVKEAIKYFALEILCLIFALCPAKFKIWINFAEIETFDHQQDKNSDLKISFSQIKQTMHLMHQFKTRQSRKHHEAINLTHFLKSVSTEMADKCVTIILDNQLFHKQFRYLQQARSDKDNLSTKSAKDFFDYIQYLQLIYDAVSSGVAQRIVQMETSDLLKRTLIRKRCQPLIQLCYALIHLGTNTQTQTNMVRVDSNGLNQHNFASKQKELLLNQIEQNDQGRLTQNQFQLLVQSESDPQLEIDLANRIGISISDLNEVKQKAFEIHALVTAKEKIEYSISEIRYSSMGKGKQCEKREANQKSNFGGEKSQGITAVIGSGSNQKSHNEFEEVLEWQKFNLIQPCVRELMSHLRDFDMIHLYNLLLFEFREQLSPQEGIQISIDWGLNSKLDPEDIANFVEIYHKKGQEFISDSSERTNEYNKTIQWKCSCKVLLLQDILQQIIGNIMQVLERYTTNSSERDQTKESVKEGFVKVLKTLNEIMFNSIASARYSEANYSMINQDLKYGLQMEKGNYGQIFGKIKHIQYIPYYIGKAQDFLDKILPLYTSSVERFATIFIKSCEMLTFEDDSNDEFQRVFITNLDQLSNTGIFRFLRHLFAIREKVDKELDELGEKGLVLKQNIIGHFVNYFVENFEKIRTVVQRFSPDSKVKQKIMQILSVFSMVKYNGNFERLGVVMTENLFTNLNFNAAKAILMRSDMTKEFASKILQCEFLKENGEQLEFDQLWKFLIQQDLLLKIVEIDILKEKYGPDLAKPHSLVQVLRSWPKNQNQIEVYIKVLNSLLQLQDPEHFLIENPKIFTKIGMTMLQTQPQHFEILNCWFIDTTGKSMFDLELEIESKIDKIGDVEGNLNQFVIERALTDKRGGSEFLSKIQQLITKEQWSDIISQRSNNSPSLSTIESASACLPYILALGELRFDMCEILFDGFQQGCGSNAAYTTLSETEMDLVLQRVKPFGIPLLNSKFSDHDRQRLADYKSFEGHLIGFDHQNELDLGILKLLYLFPQFSLHLLRQRLAFEYDLKKEKQIKEEYGQSNNSSSVKGEYGSYYDYDSESETNQESQQSSNWRNYSGYYFSSKFTEKNTNKLLHLLISKELELCPILAGPYIQIGLFDEMIDIGAIIKAQISEINVCSQNQIRGYCNFVGLMRVFIGPENSSNLSPEFIEAVKEFEFITELKDQNQSQAEIQLYKMVENMVSKSNHGKRFENIFTSGQKGLIIELTPLIITGILTQKDQSDDKSIIYEENVLLKCKFQLAKMWLLLLIEKRNQLEITKQLRPLLQFFWQMPFRKYQEQIQIGNLIKDLIIVDQRYSPFDEKQDFYKSVYYIDKLQFYVNQLTLIDQEATIYDFSKCLAKIVPENDQSFSNSVNLNLTILEHFTFTTQNLEQISFIVQIADDHRITVTFINIKQMGKEQIQEQLVKFFENLKEFMDHFENKDLQIKAEIAFQILSNNTNSIQMDPNYQSFSFLNDFMNIINEDVKQQMRDLTAQKQFDQTKEKYLKIILVQLNRLIQKQMKLNYVSVYFDSEKFDLTDLANFFEKYEDQVVSKEVGTFEKPNMEGQEIKNYCLLQIAEEIFVQMKTVLENLMTQRQNDRYGLVKKIQILINRVNLWSEFQTNSGTNLIRNLYDIKENEMELFPKESDCVIEKFGIHFRFNDQNEKPKVILDKSQSKIYTFSLMQQIQKYFNQNLQFLSKKWSNETIEARLTFNMISLTTLIIDLSKEMKSKSEDEIKMTSFQTLSDFMDECFVKTGYEKHQMILESFQQNIQDVVQEFIRLITEQIDSQGKFQDPKCEFKISQNLKYMIKISKRSQQPVTIPIGFQFEALNVQDVTNMSIVLQRKVCMTEIRQGEQLEDHECKVIQKMVNIGQSHRYKHATAQNKDKKRDQIYMICAKFGK